MVRALETIQRMLKPDGILLDLHPVAESLEVHQASRVLFVEPFRGYDDQDEDVRHAEHALAQVVQRELYAVESRREFDFVIYGSSVAELRDYLAQENAYDDGPGDAEAARREAEMATQVEAAMQAAGRGAEVAFRERGRITRLGSTVPATASRRIAK